MHAVAITRLAGSVEDEAKALARDLGSIPYEQRLKLVGGFPAVVMTTPDAARAAAMVDGLRRRGHDAVAVDDADVVPAASMVSPKQLRFDADALVSTYGLGARVAWSDIAALIRAVHRSHTETTETVTRKELAVGRAVLTMGLMMKKKVSHDITTRSDDAEPVLYVFARTAGVPWCLRERQLRYDALGDAVTTASFANFELVIDTLRTRAPGAAFDDRLVARKVDVPTTDLLAHIFARAIVGDAPFR